MTPPLPVVSEGIIRTYHQL